MKIRTTDVQALLAESAKDLRSIDYSISRCVKTGEESFVKLRISTADELQEYRDYVREQMEHKEEQNKNNKNFDKEKALAQIIKGHHKEEPWTEIQIIDGTSIIALVDA